MHPERYEKPPVFRDSGKWSDWRPRRIDALERLAIEGIDGASWYREATAEVQTVCDCENWQIVDFVSVFALTSPRTTVRRNIRNTLQFLGTGAVFPNTVGMVKRAVQRFSETGEFQSGDKVTNFRDCLLGDESAIVLDVHMSAALNVCQTGFARAIVRHRSKQQIRRLADRLGLSPSAAQACLWFGAKRRKGELPEGAPILAEYRNFLRHGRRFPNNGTVSFLA